MFLQCQDFYHQHQMVSGVTQLNQQQHLIKQEVTELLMIKQEVEQFFVANTEVLL